MTVTREEPAPECDPHHQGGRRPNPNALSECRDDGRDDANGGPNNSHATGLAA